MVRISFHFCLAMICPLLIATGSAGQPQGATQGFAQVSCTQIAVFGAVKMPGRLDAHSRIRLLEVVALVGGPNQSAGQVIRVVHRSQCSPGSDLEKANDQVEYNLPDLLRGVQSANPFVAPGEIVIVPAGGSIFVLGNVYKPQTVSLRGGMTVTRAIALVGGIERNSNLVTMRIFRTSVAGQRQDPIIRNLRAILERRTEDVLLQPWDVVEVSDELGHFTMQRLSPPIWDPLLLPRKDNSGA